MTLTRCRACLAWERKPEPLGSTNDIGGGYCRRLAPRPTLGVVQQVTFPYTRGDDGCCEGLPDVWANS